MLSASTLLVALAIDARAATDQYLASVPPDVRARSDAYFEGGYWIRLWGTLLTVAVMWLLLHTGLSRRMREAAARITLNENLLKRCSHECVEAVMAHEMGHYVLNHVYEMLLAFGIVIAVSFAIAQQLFERLRRRYQARWGIEGIADPAGLPLLVLILTVYGFATFPVTNTLIRTNEYEADVFGLNAARQPDGFAEAALKLAEYRKLDPSPWEERVFYDHPSGRTRIYTAMRWKQAFAPDRSPGVASASARPPQR